MPPISPLPSPPPPSPRSLPPPRAIASTANDAHVEANAVETFTTRHKIDAWRRGRNAMDKATLRGGRERKRQQQVFLQAAAAAAAAVSSSSLAAAAAARYLCCRLPRRAGHIQSRQCHRRLHSGRTFIQGWSGEKICAEMLRRCPCELCGKRVV